MLTILDLLGDPIVCERARGSRGCPNWQWQDCRLLYSSAHGPQEAQATV